MNTYEKIKEGSIIPIGWGTGKIFKYRHLIHDFDVQFTIDTNQTEEFVDNVKIYEPTILEEIDLSNYVLIIYSIDYMSAVYTYCEKFKNLKCIPFNAYDLGITIKLKESSEVINACFNQGVFYENLNSININYFR
ncbi:hypothetical protein [Polynucleobacter sp. CS-Odin-A6]|uniref:hypothetical protein n=1 Tax=Polynucleobacter sp. CS-Odin-A6 TaxID=2689106 RepID=UPI001C0C1DEC|nr:hypothetical protein [Polynucleobacter sp. CS-Odin-A6]MBU3621841.1 hypothetical protein [Polynucleobacter sp. CS-Odin-A6]